MGEMRLFLPDGVDFTSQVMMYVNDPILYGNLMSKIEDIESQTVVGVRVEGDDLIFVTNAETEINVGSVRGAPGASTAEALQAAVNAAGSAAAAEATAAGMVVGGTVTGDDLVLTKADGGTVVAGNVRGPQGNDGSNVLPTAEAIAQAIADENSAARAQLNATIDSQLAPHVTAAATSATNAQTARTGAEAARDVALTAQSATIAARDQALAAVGVIPSEGGITFHTGVAWYEVGATAPDTYQAISASGSDAGALSGNTGYARQAAGIAMNPQVQSRIRRVVLHNDGTQVVHYLDCDDSTKIAGVWDSVNSLQTGWVRVHEGTFDPARPIPDQVTTGNAALRATLTAHDPARSYMKGDRVLSGGSVWESLNDNNIGLTPAPGTTTADLAGTAGQVMVEIPRFYYRADYDPVLKRHSWEVVFDQGEVKPFPLLTDNPTLPTAKVVNGRTFAVHPAFQKAAVERRARYIAAFGTSASAPANNTTGTLSSVHDGVLVNAVNISNTNFRTKARNRNTGLTDPSGNANNVWQLSDYWLHHAINLLFVTEYRTLYSQAVLGGGNIGGSDYTKIAGRSATLGNASGQFNATPTLTTPSASGDSEGMIYRGIEDLWGTAWKWVDGWNIRNAVGVTEHWVANTPSAFAHNTTTGHEKIVESMKGADTWQYPSALAAGSFMGVVASGSASTYLTDGYYVNAVEDSSWRWPRLGGEANGGSLVGLFALFGNSSAGFVSTSGASALAR
ncbi:hypothetical protein ACSHWG_00940 [Leucobacter sp. Z1108]|uniref:hypothetical protein n=1 Tax=Leucobacter sp. Z1108 TaxID=3439066 RepID=UPI003F2DF27B